MPPNGLDWSQKFGQEWDEMSPERKDMANYIAITESYKFMAEVTKRLDTLPCNSNCEVTVRNETVKGKFSIWTALVQGIAIIIAALISFFIGREVKP